MYKYSMINVYGYLWPTCEGRKQQKNIMKHGARKHLRNNLNKDNTLLCGNAITFASDIENSSGTAKPNEERRTI